MHKHFENQVKWSFQYCWPHFKSTVLEYYCHREPAPYVPALCSITTNCYLSLSLYGLIIFNWVVKSHKNCQVSSIPPVHFFPLQHPCISNLLINLFWASCLPELYLWPTVWMDFFLRGFWRKSKPKKVRKKDLLLLREMSGALKTERWKVVGNLSFSSARLPVNLQPNGFARVCCKAIAAVSHSPFLFVCFCALWFVCLILFCFMMTKWLYIDVMSFNDIIYRLASIDWFRTNH